MEKILAILENHFDQVWRRCFKRDFENDGNTYISYEKIEKMYIDRCIEIAQKHPEFKFQIETAVVVDTYIKNNPEKIFCGNYTKNVSFACAIRDIISPIRI